MSSAPTARPFVKWAGSKRLLIRHLEPYFPAKMDTYLEPFLGGGSVFLHLAPDKAILSDACAPLIDTWRAVGRNPDGVFAAARSHSMDEETYYRVRDTDPVGYLQRAGRFIYLNKAAFNGLYRENREGRFNVPWGRPKSDFVVDRENLKAVSALLRKPGIEVSCADFEETIDRAQAGSFIFADPPYVTGHNDNGFIEYNRKIFRWEDQIRLAAALKRAIERGATVTVTNADHSAIRELYDFLTPRPFVRSSTLAGVTTSRRQVTELILSGGPDGR